VFYVSALVTVAFLGMVAWGVATDEHADDQASERTGLMRAIDGFARETLALD
jgi:hypothetical protein